MMPGLLDILNDARNDKQVLIGHRLFIVDDKKRNQLDKKMDCLVYGCRNPPNKLLGVAVYQL